MTIKNAWYMGAWARELDSGPTGRTLLGEPVVMFRTEDGSVAALADVCPHRAVPLSLGRVVGDRIRCPYHALEFDAGGVCRHNPHVKGPPDRLKTRTYPVVERYGMIWMWPGDPAKSDPDRIPDYGWFADPDRFTTARGYVHIAADYRLVIDNLMDLTHAEYIHVDTVGAPGASEVVQGEVVRLADGIAVNSFLPNLPPNNAGKMMWTRSERVDQYADITWRAPSALLLDLGIMEPGHPRSSGHHTPSAHILTPEGDRGTHYFWAFARDFKMGNAEVTALIEKVIGSAFTNEDKPMLEAAQRNIDLTGAKLANFSLGDAASAHVRREIERLEAAERA